MTTALVSIEHVESPAVPLLKSDCCDVWQVDLDSYSSDGGPPDVLSVEEQNRARRFREEVHRKRFIAARSALRCILARYLRTLPDELVIDASAGGRPRLAPHSPWSGALDFNLSHSEGFAAIAVAQCGPLGIDAEILRPIPEAISLAERYFSPREQSELRLHGCEIAQGFLTCWTRKEAVLKSMGTGLAVDPATIEVGMHAMQRTVFVRTESRDVELNVLSLQLGHGSVAACALPASFRQLRVSHLSFVGDL